MHVNMQRNLEDTISKNMTGGNKFTQDDLFQEDINYYRQIVSEALTFAYRHSKSLNKYESKYN